MNTPNPPTKTEQRRLQLASLQILVLENQITAMKLEEADISMALHTASELLRVRIEQLEKTNLLSMLGRM